MCPKFFNPSKSANQKKILITGITGFIGSRLAPFLSERNWTVAGLIRPSSLPRFDVDTKGSSELYPTDGSYQSLKDILTSYQPDLVIHLATHFVSEHQPQEIDSLISANIQFGTNLLEAMSASQIHHLVNVGTYWQHFEGRPYSPYSLYAATKQAFQDIITYYSEIRKISYLTIELGDTYGPNDPRKKILWSIRNAIDTQTPLECSPGEQFLDLVYITDVLNGMQIAACHLLENRFQNRIFRLSSKELISLKDLVKIYEAVVHQSANVLFGRKPYRLRERRNSIQFGETLPQWQPQIPLEQGLKEFHFNR